jgi:hypothetical protein
MRPPTPQRPSSVQACDRGHGVHRIPYFGPIGGLTPIGPNSPRDPRYAPLRPAKYATAVATFLEWEE